MRTGNHFFKVKLKHRKKGQRKRRKREKRKKEQKKKEERSICRTCGRRKNMKTRKEKKREQATVESVRPSMTRISGLREEGGRAGVLLCLGSQPGWRLARKPIISDNDRQIEIGR